MRNALTWLVLTAIKRKSDVLVTPEWAVLPEMLPWLMDQARDSQMLVVAGQTPTVRGGNYSNMVWTGIPIRDSFGHRACLVPPPRRKMFLSPSEISVLHAAGLAVPSAKDASVPTFRWRGVKVASLICFEFADIGTRESLRATTDLLTVSSWNRDWKYFQSTQESITRDNYCVSVCVNTGQYPGTRIMRPTGSNKALVAAVHGSDEPALITRQLDMAPIVAARVAGEPPSACWQHDPEDDVKLVDYKPMPPMWAGYDGYVAAGT
jgi:predicted amidohydrolase